MRNILFILYLFIPTFSFSQKETIINSNNYFDSIHFCKDSLTKTLRTNVHQFIKKNLQSTKPQGSISIGYEYGILPFIANSPHPSGGYKTEGNISFSLLNLPLELNYKYSSFKNTIGMNNYFRLSYDANRYRNQTDKKLEKKEIISQNKLSKLQLQQQQVLQKITYLNLSKQNINASNLQNTYNINFISKQINDSIDLHNDWDSILLNNKNYKIPTSNYNHSQKKDSIDEQLDIYTTKYDSIDTEINEVKNEIRQIKNLQNNSNTLINPDLSKIEQFLSHVNKFEIGLCNPSYSTFLVNSIPLQGINMEYSKNNNFLAFTYGTTINNLRCNTNSLQGKLQGLRNTYNYFDMGNLTVGRKILCLKGGVGAKNDSHIYFGLLIGKGRTNYLLPAYDLPSSSNKESNLVVELDAKYKFSEHLNVDVLLGKSSVKDEDLTTEMIKRSINEILSNYRSYALLVKTNAEIQKTKTKITFTTRWIDPYFKSFGIGCLRSDNLRYEIKADQCINNKIKYSISYKQEEDNLLKLYNYKNTLQSINNSLNVMINKQLNVRLNYTSLFRKLKSEYSTIKDKNEIITAIISYTPKTKNTTAQFNVLYSKYIINVDPNKINIESFTYTHQLSFKSGLKTSFNTSWLKNRLHDTLNNDIYLATTDFSYLSESYNSISVGCKMACKKGMAAQYGFTAKASIKLNKTLKWEADAEKIIIGDYYTNSMTEQIKKFPYHLETKLIFNF